MCTVWSCILAISASLDWRIAARNNTGGGEVKRLQRLTRIIKTAAGSLLGIPLAMGALPASASAADSPPDPLGASFQSRQFLGDRDVVYVQGQRVHAGQYEIRLRSKEVIPVYRLDPSGLRSEQSWEIGQPNTPGLHGVVTALWLVHSTPPGTQLVSDDLEAAAQQVAIWSTGHLMQITKASVPDTALRRRASYIARHAPNNGTAALTFGNYGLRPYLRAADWRTLLVAVTLDQGSDNAKPSKTQEVDIRIGGHSQVIQVGEFKDLRNFQHPSGGVKRIADATTAEVKLKRPTVTTPITFGWPVTYEPGLVLLGNGGGPSLITARPANVTVEETLTIDPDDLPTPADFMARTAYDFLVGLPAWLDWILVLVAIYLIPKISKVIDWTVSATLRRNKGKHQKQASTGG